MVPMSSSPASAFSRAPATLSLLVETLTPDSLVTCEALEIPLCEPTAPYRTGVVLSRKGPYTFRFTPSGNTLGIRAIGVEVGPDQR